MTDTLPQATLKDTLHITESGWHVTRHIKVADAQRPYDRRQTVADTFQDTLYNTEGGWLVTSLTERGSTN